MICVLSWNIQNGKGVDGVVDLARIAALIREMGDPDVVCLQEVSRGLALEGAGTPDQMAELGALFPEHEVIFGAAVDNDPGGKGARWQFGNMLLSRLPVLSRQQHLLPRPAVADARHMVRQAIDVILACADRRLRVVTTHLEFHSALQRRSQVQRLRDIEKDAWALNRSPPAPAGGPYDNLVPPAGALLCGDFNMEVGSDEYRLMCSDFAGGGPIITDAWKSLYPDRPHAPTCGIFDREQWPQGPHCRDFFFAAGPLAGAIQNLAVNLESDASDHQPLCLDLDAELL
jgi:endonuclease/exonuclease/phosphatase family metal-dependent hydrolase